MDKYREAHKSVSSLYEFYIMFFKDADFQLA